MTQQYAKFSHPTTQAEFPIPPFSNLWAHPNGLSFLIVDRNGNPTIFINRRGLIQKPPAHVTRTFRSNWKQVDRKTLRSV